MIVKGIGKINATDFELIPLFSDPLFCKGCLI